jgi:CheY-like chemotaxis protein
MNIVIIDDEPVSLTVMKQLIAKLPNCHGHAFTNAAAALIWCTNNTPDLILVDYMMPTMDGIDFTRRVRSLPSERKIPIVMVSAVVDRQVIKRALQNGVDDFLNKPFDFIQLQTCVSEMLGLRAMHGQLANKSLLLTAKALSDDQKDDRTPHLLDRNLSRARLGGDEALLAEVARVFVYTVPAVLSRIRSAILDNDFVVMLAHVVELKGAVAAVEAPDVSSCLSRLEVSARKRDPLASIAAFAMVQALTERLVAELAPIVPRMDRREVGAAEVSCESDAAWPH